MDGDADERPETLGEMVAAELARLPLSMRERPVYASDVRSFYEEKGAGVLTLNLDDLARYEKPRILMAGDRQDRRRGRGLLRLGSSAGKAARRARVRRRRVLRLPRAASELPCEHRRLQRGHRHRRRPGEPGRGEGEGNAHIVYAPERGQVGVVLLTSLNVPSSKVYASL
ncbi:MAG: hypothetical protein ACLTDR_05265 [Adlercreutzia equolifaciens]